MRQLMLKPLATLRILLMLLSAIILAACSDDDDVTVVEHTTVLELATDNTIATRADYIATSVTSSWSDNENSINLGSTEELEEAKHFQAADGAGILAWLQGDDGSEHLYFAYHSPTSAVYQAVPAIGDFNRSPFSAKTVQGMNIIWTASGDAVISFIAEQASDPSDVLDVPSQRVYYGSFKRSLAAKRDGSSGERYGFSSFTAINSNTVGSADNDVNTLFVASSLLDGTQQFTSVESSVQASGSKGDAASNVTPFLFIGWNYLDGSSDARLEGVFVDINDNDADGDKLELVSSTPTAIDLPSVDAGESINTEVYTSGRDMLFRTNDSSASPAQERLYLVRVDNSVTPADLATPVEISRGVNSGSVSQISSINAFIGDGYRALNGQNTSWLVYRESGYADGLVTMEDTDLLVAQIDAAGTVTVNEFDHNSPAAADAADVNADVAVQLSRGASRAFIYYRQVFDPAPAANADDISLFVRALRLDGSNALVSNISAESTVNDSHDSDGGGDASVNRFYLVDVDPFSEAQCNNDSSYVVFEQAINGDADSVMMLANLVSIDDFSATTLGITVGADEVILSNRDTDWNNTGKVEVLPGSATSGEGLVMFSANGNNAGDNSIVGAFSEPRPFVYAASLPNSHSIATPVQVGSDSSGMLPFPHFKLLETTARIHATVTPRTAASRDFSLDDDEACPQYAVFVANEELRSGSEEGSTYVTRRLDLRDNSSLASVDSRWSPALTEAPDYLGTDDGHEFEDIDQADLYLIPEGNNLLAIFNTETQSDEGDDGKLFVNTMMNGVWSDAALLSNDSTGPIEDYSDIFFRSRQSYEVIPGITGYCCQRALGTWVFWVRGEYNGLEDDETLKLQGRRILSLALPDL